MKIEAEFLKFFDGINLNNSALLTAASRLNSDHYDIDQNGRSQVKLDLPALLAKR